MVDNKVVDANICKVQPKDSRICEYVCIGSLDLMIDNKILADFNNLLPLNNFLKKIKWYLNISNNV